MNRTSQKTVIALCVLGLLLIMIAAAVSKRGAAFGIFTRGISAISERASSANVSTKEGATAPEFAPGTWINSEPLTLENLRGRVVLVEFWTFGCYNCRNTLPSVKNWDKKYREKGLTIVGVHSPELEEERNIDNVRRETASLGIRYPVVTDNDYKTWKAYGVEAWPTIFILDKTGRIRWSHVGEGEYDEAESLIQKLLAE